jgi:predicted transcriptional regulator
VRLIEGAIMPDEETTVEDDLRAEIRELQDQLRDAQRETATAKRDAGRAMSELRRQLGPLYKALQMVFGELDAAGVDEAPAASGSVNARMAAVWQNWKNKIGGQPAQLIDAFLLHGEMTSGQIAIAIGISPKNVAQVVHKLNKAGLIQKNGNNFSLKKL